MSSYKLSYKFEFFSNYKCQVISYRENVLKLSVCS